MEQGACFQPLTEENGDHPQHSFVLLSQDLGRDFVRPESKLQGSLLRARTAAAVAASAAFDRPPTRMGLPAITKVWEAATHKPGDTRSFLPPQHPHKERRWLFSRFPTTNFYHTPPHLVLDGPRLATAHIRRACGCHILSSGAVVVWSLFLMHPRLVS